MNVTILETGWTGDLHKFVSDNQDSLDSDEAEQMFGNLSRGLSYQFGGGAAATFTIVPAVSK